MDEFKKNSLVMLVLTTLASGINYLCQIAMGRVMSVEAFGVMNSLFSLILVLSVPGTSLNMLTAKQVAGSDGKDETVGSIAQNMRKLALYFGAGILLLTAVLSPLGAHWFKSDIPLFVLTGVAVVVSFLPYVFSGVLSGMRLFLAAGVFSLVPPILKAVGIGLAAVLPLPESSKMHGIMVMIMMGYLVALAGYLLYFRRKLPQAVQKQPAGQMKALDAAVLFVMLANFAYLLLINADVLLINICLDATAAGMYSAVMMFGRIIYYFTTALVAVLLPYVSLAQSHGGKPQKVFVQSLLLTLAASVLCMLPVNLFPQFFVQLLYGEKFVSAAVYLPLSSAAAVTFSLINLELNYYIGIGRGKKIFVDFVVSVGLLAILTVWRHANITEILLNIVLVLLLLFGYELIGCLKKAEAEREK